MVDDKHLPTPANTTAPRSIASVTRAPRIAGKPFAKRDRTGVRIGTHSSVRVSGGGVDLSFGEADNPYFQQEHRESGTNPRKIKVARNSNESPLVRLEAHGTIDQVQAEAGLRVRQLVERAAGGQGSSSFIVERVDGGRVHDGFTESRTRAAITLGKLAEEIGEDRFRIVVAVCGEGHSLGDLKRALRCRQETARDRLRDALDRTAEHFGLKRG